MRFTLVLITLFWSTANSVFAECSDADKKALIAFDKAWTAAGNNGDKAALTAIYADDYAGFPAMQSKTAAIDATMATFERNKANPPTSTASYDHYYINCTATTATVTHRNTVVSISGSTSYSRSVHIMEKRGGKWQVVSNAGHALDDSSTIWYLEQDWNDAVLKKDKAWFDKNYASDFSSVDAVTGSLANKAQDIAGATSAQLTLEIVETTDMNVRVDGDRAVVTGIFRTKGRDPQGPFDRRMRYTDVWVKRDGRWQAWSSQGTLIVP